MDCPCGSGKQYTDCCEPFILGVQKPLTAEALMRSRYTAYTVHAVDYIVSTCVRKKEQDIDVRLTREWSEKAKWLGLKVISIEKGSESDTEGIIEFEARYEQNNLRDIHHERASFKKVDDVWLYDEGVIVPETIVRSTPKVGRNEPCPCGSGRKYKHCCGKS
ncbi:MAG: YchJ family protein [Treponema sp.]|jgi:SEC-C motif-containing protein|nr:YchJ family protein [Treponema sp.]